jgi:hypothetical protein
MNFKEWFLAESIYDKNLFKAIITLGGPASGKSWITDFFVNYAGFRPAQSDMFFQNFRNQAGLSGPVDLGNPKEKELFDTAKNKNELRINGFTKGMLPIVVESTGRDLAGVASMKGSLEQHGYDVFAVYSEVPIEVALQRNRQRSRTLTDDQMMKTYRQVGENIQQLQHLFGKNFFQVNSLDPQLGKNIMRIIREVERRPIVNPIGLKRLQDESSPKLRPVPKPQHSLTKTG